MTKTPALKVAFDELPTLSPFTGKNVLYFLLISTIFIPFTVTMVPNYITLSDMGLVDSIYGVALPQLADATEIFLLRQSRERAASL